MKSNRSLSLTNLAENWIKYFYVVYALLMLVALSLHVESLLRDRFVDEKLSNHLNSQLNISPDLNQNNCLACNQRSKIVRTFNIIGIALTLILAIYCLFLAFKVPDYVKYYLFFLMIFVTLSLAILANFLFSLIYKSSSECVNSRVKCDADFDYNYNILSMSTIKLIIIPIFVYKAINSILIKKKIRKNKQVGFHVKPNITRRPNAAYVHDQNEIDDNRLSRISEATVQFRLNDLPLTESFDRNHNYINRATDDMASNEKVDMAHTSNSNISDGSFREMAIDCPINAAVRSPMPETELTRREVTGSKNSLYDFPANLNLIDYYMAYKDDQTAFQDELSLIQQRQKQSQIFNEHFLNELEKKSGDLNNNYSSAQLKDDLWSLGELMTMNNENKCYHVPTGRKFTRRSSLSTITEEKTLSSFSNSADSAKLSKSLDTMLFDRDLNQIHRFLINNVLYELNGERKFIDEVIEVFGPSSKDGTFKRNITVRFSSPSPSHLTNTSCHSSFVDSKKQRFVRRLKNRLDTKRGQSLGTSFLSNYRTPDTTRNSPRHNKISRQKTSITSLQTITPLVVRDDMDDETTLTGMNRTYESIKPPGEIPTSSTLSLNTTVDSKSDNQRDDNLRFIDEASENLVCVMSNECLLLDKSVKPVFF